MSKDKQLNTHHRIWYIISLYTIRCGVLFIYSWATPNAYYLINEQPHTFFIYINALFGVGGQA